MKISTPAQVSRRLDRSLAWRKKELTQQKLIADSAAPGNAAVLRRSGITLLYAHWEGFIKDASILYLKFLAAAPIELARLQPNFLAVALSSEIRTAGQTKKASLHADLVRLFRSIEMPPLPQRRLPWRNVIAIRWNLKSEVLREVAATLGFDYRPFALKEKPVIDKLVRLRNSIAHGEGLPVTQPDYDFLHTEIILLLSTYKDLVERAASIGSHTL